MGSLRIPRVYDARAVLLADDEPEHLDWLIDFLRAKELSTIVATNVQDAIQEIERTKFRAYLVDLNIPFGGWKPPRMVVGATYDDYHGLYIVKLVRSQGNAGGRVLAYSAHFNDQISAAVKRLYCGYIVKGRPRELKVAIEQVLERDPVAAKKTSIAKRKRKP